MNELCEESCYCRCAQLPIAASKRFTPNEPLSGVVHFIVHHLRGLTEAEVAYQIHHRLGTDVLQEIARDLTASLPDTSGPLLPKLVPPPQLAGFESANPFARTSATLSDLPVELAARVFSFLDNHSLLQASTVARAWLATARDPSVAGIRCFHAIDLSRPERIAKWPIRGIVFPSGHLDFLSLTAHSSSVLSCLGPQLGGLRRLVLHVDPLSGRNPELTSLLQYQLKSLHELHLSGTWHGDEDELEDDTTSDDSGNGDLRDEDPGYFKVQSNWRSLENVHTLSISGEASLRMVPLTVLPSLTSLRISTRVNVPGWPCLLPNLRSLHMDSSMPDYAFIAGLPSLKSLTLSSPVLVKCAQTLLFPTVEELRVVPLPHRRDDEEVISVALSCPVLVFLDVGGLPLLRATVKRLQALRRLEHVAGWENPADDGYRERSPEVTTRSLRRISGESEGRGLSPKKLQF